MIAVTLAVFPNTHRDYCWHFSGTWISCKKINVSSSSFTCIFAKAYPPCSAVCLR